jgi:hypothetical protein
MSYTALLQVKFCKCRQDGLEKVLYYLITSTIFERRHDSHENDLFTLLQVQFLSVDRMVVKDVFRLSDIHITGIKHVYIFVFTEKSNEILSVPPHLRN